MARRKKRLAQRIQSATSAREDSPTTPPPTFGPPDEDDQPVELAAFVGASLIGLLIIMALAVLFGLRSVENELEAQTLGHLRANGIRDVEVDADGRHVSLAGTVRQEDHVGLAIRIARSVEGVTGVDARNVLFVPPPEDVEIEVDPKPLVFSWRGNEVVVGGTISNEAARDVIIETVGEVWESVQAENLVVVEGIDSERDWLPKILAVVSRAGEDLEEGGVIANARSSFVLVNGELETRSLQIAVQRDVEELLSTLRFQFTNGLTVAEPPPPPTTTVIAGGTSTTVTTTTTTLPPDVVELQETLDDLIGDKVVEFDFESADITEEGRELLDEVLEALRRFPDIPVEIAGHTDSRGTEEFNLQLSRLRAAAVLAYFVDRGQDPTRFDVVGYGESRPIADNSTAAGRARNRRIEFTALSE